MRPPEELVLSGYQDTPISAVLRIMSFGHFCLGLVGALSGALLEAALHQPAFFGLAASGGLLGACGVISLLAIRRQAASPSLAFYLLPYADFAIIGLWLLLFGVASPAILFYAYVIVSAALLLGSRHAIALAGIAAATIVTVGVAEYQYPAIPAIRLPTVVAAGFTILGAMLALGLTTAVARLFSANLDRFILLSNQQSEALQEARARMDEHQRRIFEELEMLSTTYTRFTGGETGARVSPMEGSLARAAQMMNSLLEQIEQLLDISALQARLEERIGSINQALERLCNGDTTAIQKLGWPSGTSLDFTAIGLERLARQFAYFQHATQQASSAQTTMLTLASELSLLRQNLAHTDAPLSDLLARSTQSAVHLHVLLEGEPPRTGGYRSERPLLQEMELRARQQSAALEMIRARLGHVESQLEAVETELRCIVDRIEPIARPPRLPRFSLSNSPPPEQLAAALAAPQRGLASSSLKGSGALPPSQHRPASGALAGSDAARPPNGSLKPSDSLAPPPRRFNGPLTRSGPLPDRLELHP
jgi:hypothetical protein